MVLSKEEIKTFIPHREPFLFVDEVIDLDKGKRILAKRTFRNDEFFFQGHFPGNPIVPGVIIVECLAQAGGVLVNSSYKEELVEQGFENAYLIGLEKCRFRKPVFPNDTLDLLVELTRRRSRLLFFKGQAIVNGSKVAEAEISASLV